MGNDVAPQVGRGWIAVQEYHRIASSDVDIRHFAIENADPLAGQSVHRVDGLDPIWLGHREQSSGLKRCPGRACTGSAYWGTIHDICCQELSRYEKKCGRAGCFRF